MLLLIEGVLQDVDPRVDKVYYNPINIRPVAAASRGLIVLFEDKGQAAYYSDGSNWIPLNGSFAGGIRVSTGSETLSIADNYKTIVNNSTVNTSYTIEQDSVIDWEDDSFITLYQSGVGKPTFIPGTGVTFRTPESDVSITQYGHKGIHRVGPNEWAFA